MKFFLSRTCFVVFCLLALFSCNPSTIKTEFLDMETLSETEFKVSSYEGSPVFLNLWATWCKPCVEEFPSVQKMKTEMEKEGWKFVIVSDEKIDKIKGFKSRMPYDFDYYHMKKRFSEFGVNSIPQTYILNKKGEVVMSYMGGMDWNSEANKNELRDLIK